MLWSGFFFFWMTGLIEQMSFAPSHEAEEGRCVSTAMAASFYSHLFPPGVAAANHLPPCHSALCILLSHQITLCPLSRPPWHGPLGHLPASSTASLRWRTHYLTSAHIQTISLSEYIIFLLSASTCWSFTHTFAHNPLWEGKHMKQWTNSSQKWAVSIFRHRTRCFKDVRNRNRRACWHCRGKTEEPVCKLQNLVSHTAFICSALSSHCQRHCSDTLV